MRPSRPGRRLLARALMVVVGVTMLVLTLAAAVGLLVLGRLLWAARPSLPVALAALLVATLVSGYLSYRAGIDRLLRQLDAVALPRERALALHRRLDRLVERMDVPRPRLLLARLAVPNAIGLGGRSPVIAVDRALFRLLGPAELEAVIAHELAHVEGRDGLVQTVAYAGVQTAAGLAFLLVFPVVLVLTGLARSWGWLVGRPTDWPRTLPGRLRVAIDRLVVTALAVLTLPLIARSRRREYAADDRAAAVTGNPLALARALIVIDRAASPPWSLLAASASRSRSRSRSDGSASSSSETPLDELARLFRTHPPTEERVERLRERARRAADRATPRAGDRR